MKSLRIKNLKKKFKNTIAVNGINIEIDEGKIIGIIGRSGAGKSTLLRMINRLVDPTEGSIEFDDIKVSSIKGRTLRKWRSECAMIFQQFNLVERLDVLTNVLIGSLGRNYNLLNLFGIFSKEEKINSASKSRYFVRRSTTKGGNCKGINAKT